jgi:hypothetical protein
LAWKHPLSPNPPDTEIHSSAFSKVIETIFWDHKYVLFVDLRDSGDIVERYCDALDRLG